MLIVEHAQVTTEIADGNGKILTNLMPHDTDGEDPDCYGVTYDTGGLWMLVCS